MRRNTNGSKAGNRNAACVATTLRLTATEARLSLKAATERLSTQSKAKEFTQRRTVDDMYRAAYYPKQYSIQPDSQYTTTFYVSQNKRVQTPRIRRSTTQKTCSSIWVRQKQLKKQIQQLLSSDQPFALAKGTLT